MTRCFDFHTLRNHCREIKRASEGNSLILTHTLSMPYMNLTEAFVMKCLMNKLGLAARYYRVLRQYVSNLCTRFKVSRNRTQYLNPPYGCF